MQVIKDNFLGKYRIRLDPSYGIDKHILEKGSWENHIVQFFLFWLKPGFVCVDVGANAGYHTLAMAGQVAPGGIVFAFEPNEFILPRLIENLNLNPDLKSIVEVKKIGLSDRPGELKVFQSGEDFGNAYLSDEYKENYWNAGTAGDFHICRIERLDSVLPGLKIDLVKVDVEGMELEVLKGAAKLLELYRPAIIFETLIDTFDKEKIKQTEDYLESCGYLLFGIDSERGKLVSVKFPFFQEDTIAIHRHRVIEAAEIMFNAAQYLPRGYGSGENALGVLELLIAETDGKDFHVKIKIQNGSIQSWNSLKMNQDGTLEVHLSDNAGLMKLKFIDEDKTALTLTFADQNGIQITQLKKTGGQLAAI